MKRIIIFIFLILAVGVGVFVFKPKTKKQELKEPVQTREHFPEVTPTLTLFLTPASIPLPTKNSVVWAKKYGPCKRVPILTYHHVLNPQKAKEILAANLNVPPEIFRTQLDYLLEKGYTVIGFSEMISKIKDQSLPPKPVILTFDDGYRDFYEQVFPILKEKSLKATVFVITQFVGGERYVSWDQLKEMADSDLVTVGNHTLNHPYLSRLSASEVKNQILSAQNILETNLGRRPEYFAYPYGNSSQAVQEVLKEGGFSGAVLAANFGLQCLGRPYDFSRIRIGAASLSKYGL